MSLHGLTKDDVTNEFFSTKEDGTKEPKIPEKIFFPARKAVSLKIIHFQEKVGTAKKTTKPYNLLILTTKIMDGDHKDKLFDLLINRDNKKQHIKFLRKFWTMDELNAATETGTLPEMSRIRGKIIETFFMEEERGYQNVGWYGKVKDAPVETETETNNTQTSNEESNLPNF